MNDTYHLFQVATGMFRRQEVIESGIRGVVFKHIRWETVYLCVEKYQAELRGIFLNMTEDIKASAMGRIS